jgi:hypothetical protein
VQYLDKSALKANQPAQPAASYKHLIVPTLLSDGGES